MLYTLRGWTAILFLHLWWSWFVWRYTNVIRFLARKPTIRHHSILLPDLQLWPPLGIKGIIYYLPTRRPDGSEEGHLDRHWTMPDTPEWNSMTQVIVLRKATWYTTGGRLGLGMIAYPVTELQLNDESIYDFEVWAVLTEVNRTLNYDEFVIYINYWLKPGSFGLSI